MSDTPLVSVCVITYNHERVIDQALDGILSQECQFPLEIVIGEDCSSDRTLEICLQYQNLHKDKIRVLTRKKNIGIFPNFADTLRQCTGKYVAICEGDDYWIDTKKLQKQVDFLEANPDFVICFHPAQVVCDPGVDPSAASDHPHTRLTLPKITGFSDIVKRQYIPTASCVFRNHLYPELPSEFDTYAFDWTLHILNARHGKIRFIEDVMCVYRLHSAGYTQTGNWVEKNINCLQAFEWCRDFLSPFGVTELNQLLAKLNADTAFWRFEQGDYQGFHDRYEATRKYFEYLPARTRTSLLMRKLLAKVPLLSRSFRWLRGGAR